MDKRKINVLVVEDSPVVQLLLVRVLEADPRIRVMGTANDGQSALDFLAGQRPDVVLMDVHMPRMSGFDATRRIMETEPLPIVVCSATMKSEVSATFLALEAGAVAFVEKPVGPGHPGFEQMVRCLVDSIKTMAEVKVVKRWAKDARTTPPRRPAPAAVFMGTPGVVGAVVIGASTGGPPVIQTILKSLGTDFPVPVLIVQHIAPGFLDGMVEWLRQTTGMPVHAGSHGLEPMPGHVYIAPDSFHMGVSPEGRILLSQDLPEDGLRPSVSYLFRSAAQSWGAKAVGVLLTGMGKDGARELKLLRECGAVTIAQDAESSVVHSMPASAIALGAAAYVLPPEAIAHALRQLTKTRGPAKPTPPVIRHE